MDGLGVGDGCGTMTGFSMGSGYVVSQMRGILDDLASGVATAIDPAGVAAAAVTAVTNAVTGDPSTPDPSQPAATPQVAEQQAAAQAANQNPAGITATVAEQQAAQQASVPGTSGGAVVIPTAPGAVPVAPSAPGAAPGINPWVIIGGVVVAGVVGYFILEG
jgi:hypothetical protein